MARLVFPDDRDVSYRGSGAGAPMLSAAGQTAVVYADAAGTVLADVVTQPGGAPIAGSALTVDATSLLPLFQGPDGVDTLYVKVGTGPVTPVYARVDDRIDANTAALAGKLGAAHNSDAGAHPNLPYAPLASGPFFLFDAAGNVGATRPTTPVGANFIWFNVVTEPTHLGATDLWVPTGVTGVGPEVLAHGESTVTVVNTAAETDLFSYSMPAGTLSAGDRLRIRVTLDVKNNSGSGVTYQPRLYLGSTAILNGTAVSSTSAGGRRSGIADLEIVAVSSSAQRANGDIHLVFHATDTFAGVLGNYLLWAGRGTAAEDLGSPLTVRLTITMGTANANAEAVGYSYLIQKIPV